MADMLSDPRGWALGELAKAEEAAAEVRLEGVHPVDTNEMPLEGLVTRTAVIRRRLAERQTPDQ